MKLFDKIKNYFYDEEEAVEIKKESNVSVLPKEEEKPKENLDVISERDLFRSEPTFDFPVVFDEEEVVLKKEDTKGININNYENTKIENKFEKNNFRPSPVISPVYGIIDDNKNGNNESKPMVNLYEDKKTVNIDDFLDRTFEKRIDIKKDNYEDKKEVVIKEDLEIDLFANNQNEEKKNNTVRNDKIKTIDDLLAADDDNFYSLVDSMYKDESDGGGK